VFENKFGWKGAGSSLLATEVATLIYLGVSPEEDLNVEALVMSGLSWAATYAICIKLGIATGTVPYVLVGVAVDATIDTIWSFYLAGRLRSDLAEATVDDLVAQRIPNGGNYDLYIKNKAQPLRNLRLGTYFEGSAVHNDEYGVIATLNTGDTCVFSNIPSEWFEVRSRAPLGGVAWPMVCYDAALLGSYKQLYIEVDLDDIAAEDIVVPGTVIKGINWLRQQQLSNGSWSSDPANTSFAILSMLNAGFKESDSTVSKGITYILSRVNPNGSVHNVSGRYTYYTSIAILPLVATHNSAYHDEITKMRSWLIDAQWDESSYYGGNVSPSAIQYGGFGYGNSSRPDLSNTQWALMGLKAADKELGLSASSTYSKALVFIDRQRNTDGGSCYCREGGGAWAESIHTMTSASVWSYSLCGVGSSDSRVSAGIQWLTDRYSLTNNDGWGWWSEYYYKVTFAKALVMTHKTKLGIHDWFMELSEKLRAEQQAAGNWPDTGMNGAEMSTCWAIMALQTRTLPPDADVTMSIILASHADLHVYDPQGRHVGVNYSTGALEVNIPGAVFRVLDVNGNEVPFTGQTPEEGYRQVVDLPTLVAGSYRVELVGTSSGHFDLTVEGKEGGQTVTTNNYPGEIVDGARLATSVTVTAMEGALTLLYENLVALPVLTVTPTAFDLLGMPGATESVLLTVGEDGGDQAVRSVSLYCAGIDGPAGHIPGSEVTFSANHFDLSAGASQTVTATIPIPVGFRGWGTGLIVVESTDGGTRSIALSVSPDRLVGSAAVSTSAPAYDRATGQWSANVTVTNTSANPIPYPLVVLSNIVPGTVTLIEPSGTTPDGKPFVDLSPGLESGVLPAGQAATKRISFNNPSRERFTFEPEVYGTVTQHNDPPEDPRRCGQSGILPLASAVLVLLAVKARRRGRIGR